MDVIRPQKKSGFKKWWVLPVVLFVCLLFYFATARIGSADYSLERKTLRFATVQQGDFDIVVRAPGTLIPTEVRWLTADVDGRVDRVLVKPGSKVQTGDSIAVLSNPDLIQRMEELQWDLEAQQAQHIADIKDLESQTLDQQASELDAKIKFQSSTMSYKAQTALRERNQGSVSEIDYETIRMETIQRNERWTIEKNRTVSMRENVKAQIAAKQARLKKLKKQVERAQQQVDRLNVRATMNSVVQEVAIEPGQQLNQGNNIAKLVQQDQLIAQILVPELQIQNVAVGQNVIIDTRSNQVEGVVSRVSPSVINGTVEVDVTFSNELPAEARPELTVDGEIRVAAMRNSLFVERPAFAQNFREMRIFKLSDEGSFADKTLVQFGRGSASKIAIKNGLNVGDKVIVSDQSEFEAYERIKLN